MATISDLREIKAILDIPEGDQSEDVNLNFLIEQASNWIEEFLGRSLFRKARTEYYNGNGSQKLLLKARPVLTSPTIEVYVDNSGYFGAASGSFNSSTTDLTYGTDFALVIDQETGPVVVAY